MFGDDLFPLLGFEDIGGFAERRSQASSAIYQDELEDVFNSK
jgi:hypothetical protein